MAMRSNGPIMLALPPFRGVTRRLIFIAMIAFCLLAILPSVGGGIGSAIAINVILTPQLALHGRIWQFLTYAFLSSGLLNTAFALLSLWFFGAALEEERGGRWLLEYFLASAIGGGILASVLSLVNVAGISPYNSALGLWPLTLALLLAYGRMNPEAEMRLYFVLRIKAKYLVAIFLLFYLGSALVSHDRFSAITALSVALSGFIYLRFAPRRGLQYSASESWFGARNAYYRAKRRRAAKKFTVYMRKQGKDVNIDPTGRYVDPDGNPREPSNLDDTRWMN
jgi:membrane associated rhomboid family serine protease